MYFKHVFLVSVMGGSKNIVATTIGVCLKWVAGLGLLTLVVTAIVHDALSFKIVESSLMMVGYTIFTMSWKS